jgi:hypothetical protein
MIVSFSVANFRSFSAEETFSLVAGKHLSTSLTTHVIPIPDTTAQVLKTSVLYGANGAGKSNLFKALRYLKMLVLKPRKKNSGTGREVFRFAASVGWVEERNPPFLLFIIWNGAASHLPTLRLLCSLTPTG